MRNWSEIIYVADISLWIMLFRMKLRYRTTNRMKLYHISFQQISHALHNCTSTAKPFGSKAVDVDAFQKCLFMHKLKSQHTYEFVVDWSISQVDGCCLKLADLR